MEQEELFGPNALPRKPLLEDDEWSLQVVILPVSGLLHSLKGTCLLYIAHLSITVLSKTLTSFNPL